MAQSQESKLSRAVSQVDLAAALTSLPKEQELIVKYTQEQLLALRPGTEKNGAHVEVADIGSPTSDGVTTPPNFTGPAPPPPTPASPGSTATPDDGAQALNDNTNVLAPPAAGGEQKKRKKKKSSGKNKQPAPTGFEGLWSCSLSTCSKLTSSLEFYADPPITPEEHEEECDIYDPSRPFANRIQTCIQRYRARRNLDSTRANIFTKYLMLGGVDSTLKAFTGGIDKEIIESSTAAEISAIQATDYVRTGTQNAKFYDGSDNWVVDFEGIAKGFFSYRIPRMFSIDHEKEIKLYCLVIRNFLNYVLQHAVCPEYTEDIMAARTICDLAEKELWAIKQLQLKLPGDFNVAASTLHSGRYKDFHLNTQAWGLDDPDFQDYVTTNPGFSTMEAERIFKTAIAFAGDDSLFMSAMNADVHIVKTERKFYEVAEIERPSIKTIQEFASVKNIKGETGYIKALGSVRFKAWEGPGLDAEDFTDDEDSTTQPAIAQKVTLDSFWLEDEILELLFVGLKLELEVHELNIGIKFFDTVIGLHCSFHTYLPNEKMVNWKEPAPNTRPPPTEDDPDVEERAMDSIMEREIEV